jgi:DNA-binding transcriptional regulator YdaS (Cro superfamily)
MDIRAYCAAKHQTVTELATLLGMHRGHLHKIVTGERGWTSETAIAIENKTKGLVTPNDLAAVRRRYLRRAARRKGGRGA